MSTDAQRGRVSAAGVTGSCELPDTGSGDQTQVLWEINKCFQLSHLSSPKKHSLCKIPIIAWHDGIGISSIGEG